MSVGEKEKFGVIVCPNCQAARAVDLSNETTGCHRCGKRLVLKDMRIYYRTDSKEEAGWAIGRLNAEMSDGELPEREKKETDDPHVIASKEAGIADNEKERLSIVGRILGEEMGCFEIEDVERVYELMGRDAEDLGKKLRRLEDVYEKEEGVFSSV
ncbi:MAG: DUF5817 domain-containing protein [Candidatus Natronoplasma sp.]